MLATEDQLLLEAAARGLGTPRLDELDAYARAATQPRFLRRLLRYRLTRPRSDARALVRAEALQQGLPADMADGAALWLCKRANLLSVLYLSVVRGRMAAMEQVLEALGVSMAAAQRPRWIVAAEIARFETELARLRAVEVAKLEDERTIADLRIELAVAAHREREAAPERPARPAEPA